MQTEITREQLLEALGKAKTHKDLDVVAQALGIKFEEGVKVNEKKEMLLKDIDVMFPAVPVEPVDGPEPTADEPENAPEEENGPKEEPEDAEEKKMRGEANLKPVEATTDEVVELYKGQVIVAKADVIQHGKRYVQVQISDGSTYMLLEEEFKGAVTRK